MRDGLIEDFQPKLSHRALRVRRSSQPFDDRSSLLRLDRNEDVVGWDSTHMQDFLSAISSTTLAAYHDASLTESRIAKWTGLESDSILVTAGSSEALQMIFETYVNHGDTVLTLNPSYALYDFFVDKCGGQRKGIDFDETLRVGTDDICSRIREQRPAVVVLANPNQPTGSMITESELRRIAELLYEQGALLIVDEAYFLFCPISAVGLIQEMPNIVITRTFSKAFGLAGLRVGFAAANSTRIEEISRFGSLTRSNSVALVAANYVLDNWAWMQDRVESVIEGREFLIRSLQARGVVTFHSYANFALLGCKSEDAASALVAMSRDAGYAIRGPISLGGRDGFVRITAAPRQVMEAFLGDTSNLIARYASKPAS